MRVSSDLSGEASAKSEALAKEDWTFGGLRRTVGATGSCPWGSTGREGWMLHLIHGSRQRQILLWKKERELWV